MAFRVPVARRRATLAVLRRQARAEAAAVQQQLVLFRAARRDILAAIAQASGFQQFHLGQLLADVDRAITRGTLLSQQLLDAATRGAFTVGTDMIDTALVSLGVGHGITGLTSGLLQALIDVTQDQVRGVWRELGSRLKTAIRRAVLGIDDPFAAMGRVAAAIRDPKTFGSAMNRAEVIVRTEMGRTFSLASQERMKQAGRSLPGFKKYWLNAHDDRVRPTHQQAGEDYAPGGDPGPIPVDEPFIVGGSKLMQPLDPNGPPEETINCRCVSVPYVEDVKLPADLQRAS